MGSIPGEWEERKRGGGREITAPHRQASLRVPGQPLTMVAGPKEDLSAEGWPLPLAHHHTGHSPDGYRSSVMFVLTDDVTGAWGQKRFGTQRLLQQLDTFLLPLAGKFSQRNERNKAPNSNTSVIELTKGGSGRETALTAMLTAMGGGDCRDGPGGLPSSCPRMQNMSLPGRRQEWSQRPTDPHWCLLAWWWWRGHNGM